MLNEAQVLSSSFHISVSDIVYESMRLRLPVGGVGGEGVEVGAEKKGRDGELWQHGCRKFTRINNGSRQCPIGIRIRWVRWVRVNNLVAYRAC